MGAWCTAPPQLIGSLSTGPGCKHPWGVWKCLERSTTSRDSLANIVGSRCAAGTGFVDRSILIYTRLHISSFVARSAPLQHFFASPRPGAIAYQYFPVAVYIHIPMAGAGGPPSALAELPSSSSPALKFQVLAQCGRARASRMTLPHYVCETPMFMPVGTQGAPPLVTGRAAFAACPAGCCSELTFC